MQASFPFKQQDSFYCKQPGSVTSVNPSRPEVLNAPPRPGAEAQSSNPPCDFGLRRRVPNCGPSESPEEVFKVLTRRSESAPITGECLGRGGGHGTAERPPRDANGRVKLGTHGTKEQGGKERIPFRCWEYFQPGEGRLRCPAPGQLPGPREVGCGWGWSHAGACTWPKKTLRRGESRQDGGNVPLVSDLPGSSCPSWSREGARPHPLCSRPGAPCLTPAAKVLAHRVH